MADDDVWGVYWPGDDGASVPDVHAAEDCPQPQQLGARADGGRAHAQTRTCVLVHMRSRSKITYTPNLSNPYFPHEEAGVVVTVPFTNFG